MNRSVRHLVEQTALAFTSAFLFVLFFELNGWVFSNFAYSDGISWVFLPAGFRVILVLVFGLPGALGLVLGSWFIDSALFSADTWLLPFLNGLVSGLTPWVVMKYLQHKGWLAPHIMSMSAQRLLQMTLIFSAASAISHQLLWWLFERQDANNWVDVWPMFIGNALGALLMLYGFKFALDRIRPNRSNLTD
jgi:ABC-type Fe3+-siderophore transport system permease subunit